MLVSNALIEGLILTRLGGEQWIQLKKNVFLSKQTQPNKTNKNDILLFNIRFYIYYIHFFNREWEKY